MSLIGFYRFGMSCWVPWVLLDFILFGCSIPISIQVVDIQMPRIQKESQRIPQKPEESQRISLHTIQRGSAIKDASGRRSDAEDSLWISTSISTHSKIPTKGPQDAWESQSIPQHTYQQFNATREKGRSWCSDAKNPPRIIKRCKTSRRIATCATKDG